MTDDAGLKLLSAVEALMAEVKGLRADLASRDGNVTQEMEDLRAQAVQLAALRQGNRDRAKRCRAKSRDGNVTEAKLPKRQEAPSRTGNVTGDYRGKDLALTEKKEEQPPTPVTSCDVTPKHRVWAFWKAHLGKASTSKFDRKRRSAVEARLRDGYTVAQLCEAIRGCKADPFSMGQNDRHQRYDDLSLICRDAAHVDKFIALAPKAKAESNGVPKLAPWELHAQEEEEVLRAHGIGRAS